MSSDSRAIMAAARALANGDLVAFPTETVYGLGADACNEAAVAELFARKGRPADHPLIVHVAPGTPLADWASGVPDAAQRLVERFWPGPLTLILRRGRRIPFSVTGGQETVGLRCPAHPMAIGLLEAFRSIGSGAVAAPSANRFGRISPTAAAHVREEFGDGLRVLDGGACPVGIESTILDLSQETPVLRRPGAITGAMLSAVLGRPLESAQAGRATTRVSGDLAAHYAPLTPLSLVAPERLSASVAGWAAAGERLATLAFHAVTAEPAPHFERATLDAAVYAQSLYETLRRFDRLGVDRIVVEAPPLTEAWDGVRDRLQRAAAGSGRGAS
jgi:L-threonylcarbamoyladenylate synthase